VLDLCRRGPIPDKNWPTREAESYSDRVRIDERTVVEATSIPLPTAQVGWFAARQPAVLRFLDERLGVDTDLYALGLESAWRLCWVFEYRDGAAPNRLSGGQIERAEEAVLAAVTSADPRRAVFRQPSLCAWIERLLMDPPVLLTKRESRTLGLALVTLVFALDEITTRRATC